MIARQKSPNPCAAELAVPVITSPLTATGTATVPFIFQITATNTPTSFGAANLPAGLTVNAATGLISGTPVVAATVNVTISATNSAGTGSATLALTIASQTVIVLVITSPLTATGTTMVAFSYQIYATGNPTSFGATGLPSGLTVNSATGVISGTPASAGPTNVTISATNVAGTGSATLVITISAAAIQTYTAISKARRQPPYGDHLPYAWSDDGYIYLCSCDNPTVDRNSSIWRLGNPALGISSHTPVVNTPIPYQHVG